MCMYFICICSYVIEDDLAPSRKNVWTVSIQYSYHQDQEVTLQLTYILCATFIHNTCCSTFTTMYIHMIFFIELLYHTTRRHTRQFCFNGTSCTLFWQFNYFLLFIVLWRLFYTIFHHLTIKMYKHERVKSSFKYLQISSLKKQRLFIWGHMYAIHKIVCIFFI